MQYNIPPAPTPPKKDSTIVVLAGSVVALAAAVIIFALATRSSGDSNSGSGSGSKVSDSTIAVVNPVNKYDAYYEYVLNESGRANSMSKSDVIKLGDLVCQAFDEGYSAGAVVNIMADASKDSSDIDLAAAALWGATEYLCSEYKPMVQAYLNN